jgi:asparaginyl-tRNA synthetase
MEYTDINEILSGKEGKIKIRGWLHNKRSSGGIQFLIFRDGTGFIQCTLSKNKLGEKIFDEIERLPVESAAEIEGIAKADKRAPGGYEISVDKIAVVSKAEGDFPITKKKHGIDYLLDNRAFWLRSKKMFNIMIIRSKVLEAAREWFKQNKFVEVQVPTIVGTAVEGGSSLFELKYFDNKAYLTQSWQLYGEAMISAFGKCFTIAPSFRAEPSKTRRHLTEYWHLEAEMPFCDFEQLIAIEEQLVTYIAHKIAKECEKELKELKRDSKDLLKIKPPFPRITYNKTVDLLQKDGIKIKYGTRLGADEEDVLIKHFSTPFFVTHFPKEAAAFYHKPDSKDPKLTLSADLYSPESGGEISGGGQRSDSVEELMRGIKEQNLKPEDYKWYLDLRRWGSSPHSGFGLGIERMIMWLCKLKHIRDAVAFPRFVNRVYP